MRKQPVGVQQNERRNDAQRRFSGSQPPAHCGRRVASLDAGIACSGSGVEEPVAELVPVETVQLVGDHGAIGRDSSRQLVGVVLA